MILPLLVRLARVFHWCVRRRKPRPPDAAPRPAPWDGGGWEWSREAVLLLDDMPPAPCWVMRRGVKTTVVPLSSRGGVPGPSCN